MAKHRHPAIRTNLNHLLAGREPAMLAMLCGITIKLISAFWLHLSTGQQSLLNAAVAAAIGVMVAYATSDGYSAAILGLAQALIALAIGFGLHVDADTQALIMSFISIAVAMFTRTQVTAPLPPEDAVS
jgi:hypothetical protein